VRVLCALALLASSGGAQTFTVTNDAASGPGSLSAAVQSAAAGETGSLINFSGVDGNVAAGSELFVSNAPTISAAGTSLFTVPDLVSVAGTLTLDMGGATGAVTGAVSDASETSLGSLTVKDSAGGGVLTLSGADAYSGGTTINGTVGAGVGVRLGAAGALGVGPVTMTGGGSGHADLDLQNFSQSIGALTGDAGSTIELGSGVLTIDQNANTVFSGVISDGAANPIDWTGGALVKNGAGTLILAASANSLLNGYSGGTTLNAGILGVYADSDLGASSGGLTFNGGTLQAEGASGLTSNRSIVLQGGGGTFDANGLGSSLTGTISGAGGLTVVDSAGHGVLTLTNTFNSYLGGTFLNSGTLSVFGDGSLGALSGGITFDGGTLQANGATGLQSARTIDLLVGGGTFDANGLTSTLSGVISGGALTVEDGTGGFGSLTLANAANTYSGGTTLDSGVLRVSVDGDLGSIIGGLTFNGGTLQAFGGAGLVSARTVTLNSNGGVFDANGLASTLSGGIGGLGGLTVMDSAGGGSLTLTDAGNSYQGGTTLNSGTLIVSADGDLGAESGLLTFNGGVLQSGAAGLNIARSLYLAGGGGTFNANGLSSTFSGQVGGTGGLTLEDTVGGGVLTLTNAGNNYLGGTTLNSGTLSVVADADLGDPSGGITFNGGTLQASAFGTGLSSARAITLAGDGTFDANGLESFLSGTISGGGQMTFVDGAGGGSVELSGANTYSGGTVIQSARVAITNGQALGGGLVEFNGGVLQAAGAGINLPNELVLFGAGTLDAAANDMVVSGAISGSGLLTLTDSLDAGGQITLQGANSATGGISIVGTVAVAANAANALGSGPVTMTSGSGTATLTVGADQAIGALTGDANSVVQLVGADLTVGGNGASTVFAGSLIDDGGSTLTKTGGGVFTLSGPWSVATADVAAGTLQLGANATDSGAIVVNSGAAFALNGFNQTGSGQVINNGTISTGSGVLSAGSYSGSGTLVVDVLNSGASLRVSGGADVNGQTLVVAGHPATGDYTIVQAGALTGEFTLAPLSGYSEIPSYSLTGMTLELIAGTFTQAGQSANQSAVAAAINAAVPGASSDLTAVLGQLSALTPARLDTALDQIGPAALAAMSGISYAAAGLQSAALGQRMSGLQGGDFDADGGRLAYFQVSGPAPQRPLLADGIGDSNPWDLSARAAPSGDSPLGFFAAAVDATGRLDSIGGASGFQPGYSFGSAGGLVGGDYRLDEQTVAGAFLGYIDGAAQIAGGGSVASDSVRGGGYFTAWRGGFRTEVSAGAAYDLFTTSRDIALLSRTATASPRGAELDFDAQTSYDLQAGSCVVAPFVGASYDQLTVAAFSESGAGSMDLSVARQTMQSIRSALGAKVSRRYALGGLSAVPFASLGWGHEYADQSRAINAELAGGAGGPFTVQTADVARDSALLAAGVDFGGRGGWDVRLAYAGDVRSDFVENSVSGSLRLAFDPPDWIP
jgi:fibronectin-binding autotransporter adhesin